MCFAINQENESAFQKQLELWNDKELVRLGWSPKRWVDAFSFPLVPVILNEPRKIELLQWGLVPSWVKTAIDANDIRSKTLNSRQETMFTLPSFKDSAKTKRCLIPVNAFYEYQHLDRYGLPDSNGKATKFFKIKLKDHEVFFLAGLWAEWQGKKTFTIVTTEANQFMSVIHNAKKRMPVIIPKEKIEQWFLPGNLEDLETVFVYSKECSLEAEETEKETKVGKDIRLIN